MNKFQIFTDTVRKIDVSPVDTVKFEHNRAERLWAKWREMKAASDERYEKHVTGA